MNDFDKLQSYKDDLEDNYQYETVDDNLIDDEDDDDLVDALAQLQLKQFTYGSPQRSVFSPDRTTNSQQEEFQQQQTYGTITEVRPSVVDDFIRNFFIKNGLNQSLEIFNREWYELQSKGLLSPESMETIPDLYQKNQELDQQTKILRDEVKQMKDIAGRAQGTWDKFRKERDYHRMNHNRVVQEKNILVTDLKRLKNHMKAYEPAIDELKRKYELMIREKMLIKLERDRLKLRVKVLDDQVSHLTQLSTQDNTSPSIIKDKNRSATLKVRKQAIFPLEETIINPYTNLEFDVAEVNNFLLKKSFKGHLNSVSTIAFHPKKPIFATGSDDEVWKLWTLSDCELVMSGEGHKGWLSGLHFHPHGSHLATSSGDSTVKIWEFAQARCSTTFTEHTQAVWGCEFHYAGDYLATCSMDHTIKIWDLIANKCRQTLRGHVDSVNAICWQPYSSNVCSASGDKTVSIWDGRTGLCVQTLYGHTNSCNHVAMTNQGNTIVSCDADGIIKAWDVRMVSELGTIETGQYPINKLSIDRGGHRVVGASDDGTIKVINLDNFTLMNSLTGHDGPVQSVAFSPNDAYFVSGSSDCTFKIWGM